MFSFPIDDRLVLPLAIMALLAVQVGCGHDGYRTPDVAPSAGRAGSPEIG